MKFLEVPVMIIVYGFIAFVTPAAIVLLSWGSYIKKSPLLKSIPEVKKLLYSWLVIVGILILTNYLIYLTEHYDLKILMNPKLKNIRLFLLATSHYLSFGYFLLCFNTKNSKHKFKSKPNENKLSFNMWLTIFISVPFNKKQYSMIMKDNLCWRVKLKMSYIFFTIFCIVVTIWGNGTLLSRVLALISIFFMFQFFFNIINAVKALSIKVDEGSYKKESRLRIENLIYAVLAFSFGALSSIA